MRAIILLMVAMMIIAAPSYSQNTKEKKQSTKAQLKAEKKAEKEAVILNFLSDNNFKIIISHIYPRESAAMQDFANKINRVTSDGYFVKLDNNLFSCYLPYMGVSRTAVMGGQSLSLEAKEQKVIITKEYDSKKECYLFQFNYKNENVGDTWKCTIQVYTNGESNILMDGNSRDSISYKGEIELP